MTRSTCGFTSVDQVTDGLLAAWKSPRPAPRPHARLRRPPSKEDDSPAHEGARDGSRNDCPIIHAENNVPVLGKALLAAI